MAKVELRAAKRGESLRRDPPLFATSHQPLVYYSPDKLSGSDAIALEDSLGNTYEYQVKRGLRRKAER